MHTLTNISLFSHLIIYAFLLSHSLTVPPPPCTSPIPHLLTPVRACVGALHSIQAVGRGAVSQYISLNVSNQVSSNPFHQECLRQAVPKHNASKNRLFPSYSPALLTQSLHTPWPSRSIDGLWSDADRHTGTANSLQPNPDQVAHRCPVPVTSQLLVACCRR